MIKIYFTGEPCHAYPAGHRERVPERIEDSARRPFGNPRVQTLFAALVVFNLQLRGFTNTQMRVLLAHMLGFDPANCLAGKLT